MARATTADQVPLVLGQPAPDSIDLVHGQGVGSALLDHRAAGTDLLRAPFSLQSGMSSFTLGVEEHRRIQTPAAAFALPVPEVGIRAGETVCGDGHGWFPSSAAYASAACIAHARVSDSGESNHLKTHYEQ